MSDPVSSKPRDITVTITPIWAIIEHVRKRIRTELAATLTDEKLDATIICASELCENAIKYGDAVSQMQFIQFLLRRLDSAIQITVTNGVTSPSDLGEVKDFIERINKSQAPGQLYLDRLKELMEDATHDRTRLGLYRIAHETGFTLDYTLRDEVVTVTATLDLK
ncbi:MAG: hypothetical protein QNJ97_22680 [Myxococcota bacterium]|nr:hypothetical protein [Myxococcota bacterium]